MKWTQQREDSGVIHLQGRIDVSNSNELKTMLAEKYNEGMNVITINFEHVTSIDSSGIGKLLLFQKKLKDRGGELKLVNVKNEYIMNMFRMIHLHKVISIEDA